jgi:hypothetical protein
LSNDFEWGLHERQRTKQTNTGVEVKKEADRDNEAKSAQTNQWADFGQVPGLNTIAPLNSNRD